MSAVKVKANFASGTLAPITVYSSEGLLNMFLGSYYRTKPDYFQASGRADDAEVSYRYKLNTAPSVKLSVLPMAALSAAPSATPPPHNLTVALGEVSLLVAKDGIAAPLLDANIPITAYGILTISDGKLKISSLALVVEGHTFGDKLLQRIIDTHVLPHLAAKLQNIDLPQLSNLIGQGIDAKVSGAEIENSTGLGEDLRLDLNIEHIAAEPTTLQPNGSDAEALHSSEPNRASALAFISGDAINKLMPYLMGGTCYPFESISEDKTWGVGAAVRGAFYCDTPFVTVVGDVARAYVNIITNMDVAVEGFWTWTWLSLKVPRTQASVIVQLESSANKGKLRLLGIEHMHFDIGGDWPILFLPVKALIEALIDGVVNSFRGQISQVIAEKINIEVINLDKGVFGAELPAKLSFAPGGLNFYDGSVRALVNIEV